ncbi:hypothetical protein NP233_g9451 [Leucocoprinus birnbaumii]|uniref:Uncharacterized protein n=1 Tax=Leucocoprinus birnbaumii TaxID=56174 RepID=A0AAD5VKD0_9AGAR|nr:hypothetical protein NP233_g9451 [Leucocoprinus birnbaumii]
MFPSQLPPSPLLELLQADFPSVKQPQQRFLRLLLAAPAPAGSLPHFNFCSSASPQSPFTFGAPLLPAPPFPDINANGVIDPRLLALPDAAGNPGAGGFYFAALPPGFPSQGPNLIFYPSPDVPGGFVAAPAQTPLNVPFPTAPAQPLAANLQPDQKPKKRKAKDPARAGNKKAPAITTKGLMDATGGLDESDEEDGKPDVQDLLMAHLDAPQEPHAPWTSLFDIPGYDPLRVGGVDFWRFDKPDPSAPKDHEGRFTLLEAQIKARKTAKARSEYDAFLRRRRVIPSTSRNLIQREAAFLPEAMMHSRRTTRHLLTSSARNTLCTYHKDMIKKEKMWDGANSDTRKYRYATGTFGDRDVARTIADPARPRKPGLLHCGCPEDVVYLECYLRKVTRIPSGIPGVQETMQNRQMHPQDRILLATVFTDWAGLTVDDLYRYEGGRLEPKTYAEVLDHQIAVLQRRRANLDQRVVTPSNHWWYDKQADESEDDLSDGRSDIMDEPLRKRQKRDKAEEGGSA